MNQMNQMNRMNRRDQMNPFDRMNLLDQNSHEKQMNRRQLMEHINQVSFAVDDVKLYLDTHPCDQEALAYFHEMSRQRNRALKEYAACYGPLTIDSMDESCGDRWNWINEPWPWQEGGC